MEDKTHWDCYKALGKMTAAWLAGFGLRVKGFCHHVSSTLNSIYTPNQNSDYGVRRGPDLQRRRGNFLLAQAHRFAFLTGMHHRCYD